MIILTVIALLSGAAAGRTMTAYAVFPASCAACLAALAASDMSLAGFLWNAVPLVVAVQAGFVAGAAGGVLVAALKCRYAARKTPPDVAIVVGRRHRRRT